MARMLGQGLEYLDFIQDAQKAHSEIHSYSIKRASIEAYQIATVFSRNDSHYDNFGISLNSRKIADNKMGNMVKFTY
jgi:hypothetical protein